jgi:diketogulonate reductase-like aldo/keto reductase
LESACSPRHTTASVLRLQSKPGDVQRAVQDAIDAGYTHLDCAYVYGNEAEVGQGIKIKMQQGVVRREDLFITSKVSFRRPDSCTSILWLCNLVCNLKRRTQV